MNASYIPFRWHEALVIALVAGVVSYFLVQPQTCNPPASRAAIAQLTDAAADARIK